MKPTVEMVYGDATPCQPGCVELDCECGDTLHVRRINDAGEWYVQHGDNPEHVSRTYGSYHLFMAGTREWRGQIHARR